ncbi:XRE family transcriptional regulator [Streptomyces sp. P38-E01]|uniref:XRE family transcriptional regulator n=1 Tax=Streptomyces tardus TaxID=2780544 RepID=A0A949N7M8_9ACTN|nr:XRE family transcriptional regulator [Streptomyces tardus]MBU7600292.1 XRE family transcriptional regulator [Streptomyces tardus]
MLSVHDLAQSQLGEALGYDKTYISLVERGRRRLDDLASRRHIAVRLRLPPHVLGITDPADSDHRAMVQFGASTIRLADIARQNGHAADAVAELWPLVARWEARIADGHAEREVVRLLARARVGLGVALGNVLPEERLPTAAHWTAKAVRLARFTEDPTFTSYALRMHGNELRKAGLHWAAVHRLRQAAALASDPRARAAVLPLLVRAAGELGDSQLFDTAISEAEALVDTVNHTSLVNPAALYEIRLRGLISTGRTVAAVGLLGPPASTTAAPQWRVIEAVTVGQVQLVAGDRSGAAHSLRSAAAEAARQRRPHQLQRIVRVSRHTLPEVSDTAGEQVRLLKEEMTA